MMCTGLSTHPTGNQDFKVIDFFSSPYLGTLISKSSRLEQNSSQRENVKVASCDLKKKAQESQDVFTGF